MKIWPSLLLVAFYAPTAFTADCPTAQGRRYNKNKVVASLSCLNEGLQGLEQTNASLQNDVAALKSGTAPGSSDVSQVIKNKNDIALLQGITPQPLVSMYEDEFFKMEISGSSLQVDSNGILSVHIAFLVRNKTAVPLLLGRHNRANAVITDENGNSCEQGALIRGLEFVQSNSQSTAYSSIAPGSSVSAFLNTESRCSNLTGNVYNLSTELMRYDSVAKFGIPVGVGFTGVTILPQ